ncbi:hypothetical protein [Bradyrhizobium canariense]|uniref:hypothetical protein n=1 Tax=Bradyrhizobium canariense TaxID=255045 RepID=UPI0019132F6C|nr:hypothetical protein [Bradyrhizobium canariense]
MTWINLFFSIGCSVEPRSDVNLNGHIISLCRIPYLGLIHFVCLTVLVTARLCCANRAFHPPAATAFLRAQLAAADPRKHGFRAYVIHRCEPLNSEVVIIERWRGANAVRSQQNAQRSQLRQHDLELARDLLRLVRAVPGPRHDRAAQAIGDTSDSREMRSTNWRAKAGSA